MERGRRRAFGRHRTGHGFLAGDLLRVPPRRRSFPTRRQKETSPPRYWSSADTKRSTIRPGLMLRVDARNWVKAGVEYTDGLLHFSAVVTTGRLLGLVGRAAAGRPRPVRLRLTRHGEAIRVQYERPSGWQMARLGAPSMPARDRDRTRWPVPRACRLQRGPSASPSARRSPGAARRLNSGGREPQANRDACAAGRRVRRPGWRETLETLFLEERRRRSPR